MFNLLKAELYKLTKTKSLYICLIIMIAVAVLNVFTIKLSVDIISSEEGKILMEASSSGEPGVRVGSSDFTGFDNILKPTAYEYYYMTFGTGELVVIFICIFASIFIASEYSNGTYKLIIAKGKGRINTYLAKLTSVSIVSAVYSIIYMMCSVILAVIIFGWGKEIGGADVLKMLSYFGAAIFAHIAYGSMLAMLAFVLRSTAASIALGIAGAMIISLIGQVVYLLTDLDLTKYWITSAISGISMSDFTTGDIARSLLVSAAYLVGSTALGMYAFKRRDLK